MRNEVKCSDRLPDQEGKYFVLLYTKELRINGKTKEPACLKEMEAIFTRNDEGWYWEFSLIGRQYRTYKNLYIPDYTKGGLINIYQSFPYEKRNINGFEKSHQQFYMEILSWQKEKGETNDIR